MVANKSNTILPVALGGEATGVLLVVAAVEDVAKRIESHLRNAGHPLRAGWVSQLDALEDALRHHPPELLLYEDSAGTPPLDRLIGLCALLRPDLAVIAIGPEHSLDETIAALAAGAQERVAYGDPQQLRHLELVVIREFVRQHHLRQLRLTQARLADFELRHQQLTENTADAVAHVQEGIVVGSNLAFTHLLGYDSPEQLAGQPLIDLVDSQQQSRIKERLRAVLRGKHGGEPLELALVGTRGRIQVRAQLMLGSVDGESMIELLIRAEGGKGVPAGAQIAFGGRSAFAATLAATLGETPENDGKTVRGALLLRIDAHPALEGRIGTTDAEMIVSSVAQAVHARLGPQDQSFAFSTDEIALVIHRPNLGEIEQFGEFLRLEIAGQIFAAHQHEAQVTLSVAVFPLGGQEPVDDVIRQLVEDVRRLSTRGGGNQVVILGAAAKTGQSEREDAQRAALVRKAIEDNRLKLAYQSIASLEGESRSHYDVLVRIADEAGKELQAGEFLPAAARFNLMRTIDRWVVARVLGMIARRAATQEASVLFVKISEDTLKDADGFVEWLKSQTADHPLKRDELIFEIQERVLQNHIRKAKSLTQALIELGAGVAIDHYGAGANSAQLLDHIPAHFLKFHASYTQQFAERETQKRLADLVEIAKQRGIKTIVSHVEDANVMARLWQMGVNFIQGYHVQEPEVVLTSIETERRS